METNSPQFLHSKRFLTDFCLGIFSSTNLGEGGIVPTFPQSGQVNVKGFLLLCFDFLMAKIPLQLGHLK